MLKLSVTVWPSASVPSRKLKAGPVSADAAQTSMFVFTAAPSRGLPSWKTMPSLMVSVQDVKSSLGSTVSTR